MKFNFYPQLYLWLTKHRRWVLTVMAALMVVSVAISSRLNFEEDIFAILSQDDAAVAQYQYALKKFRQIDRVYIDVGIATDDVETLMQAADAVARGLSENPSVGRIMYRMESQGQRKILDFLSGGLPNLFTETDAKSLEEKLNPAAVRENLTAMRRHLAGAEGMVLKDLVPSDPIGMSGIVLNKLLPLQTGFSEAHIEDGRILSSDRRHVLILTEPNFPPSDSRASEALVADILRVTSEIEKQFPGVRVALTGGHRMTADNSRLIQSDTVRCMTLGMAAMLVLCVVAYRRRWLSLVTFIPSFYGTLLAGVVLALWHENLSAIAVGFASVAIGITVDFAIYVVYHLDEAAGLDRETVGHHLARLVLPIGVGALTTIAAFAVMITSPMRGYQQLGVFGAFGVLFSALFALLILPLLVPVARKTGQASLWLTRLLEKFYAWRQRRIWWLLATVAALTVASVFGMSRLRFEGDIAKLNGVTDSTRRDEAIIHSVWGEAFGMTLVITRGVSMDEAMENNDRAAEALANNPKVATVSSLAAICPSISAQKKNCDRWRAFWTKARRQKLRETLQTVGAELGFRSDAFAPFWERLEAQPEIITLETFRDTPLEQILNERVAVGANDTAVSTLVKLEDRSQAASLIPTLSQASVLDGKMFADHIAQLAKDDLSKFALYTSIIVAVILYLSLGSIEVTVATLLPLAFGILWTFGAMGWLGLPINIINSVFVIFIIGIGEDYSLFLATSKLDEWRGRPQRLAVTSATVTISALTTIFGFAVLVFAQHPVLFSMGTTVLLGMGFSFVATVILTLLFMDVLLFADPPRGAPRWWHLLGTLWSGTHLLIGESYLFLILPRFVSRDRVRRTTARMTRGLVKTSPFGKLEFCDLNEETFKKPAILISNHQSAVDVLIIKSLPGNIRMTLKKRVWDTPTLGIGAKVCGDLLVEPNKPEVTLARCREELSAGASVHFFPEGTRSFTGDLQRFHLGAFQLAIELQQDVLPILLCDTNTAMPRDSYWFEPFHAVVRALPRVTPQNFDYNLGARALAKHCETLMHTALQAELDCLNTNIVLRRKVARLYRYQGKWIEQFVYWKMRRDPLFDTLDKIVPRHGFILDLGCGYGISAHWLAQSGLNRELLGVDYDADKIRVAQRTAVSHPRVLFESADLQTWNYPACDVALLCDVLHYWPPETQELILTKARNALRGDGRLILRESGRAETKAHRQVESQERFATNIGHNKAVEGLHFLSEDELRAMLERVGFQEIQFPAATAGNSNIFITASVAAPQSSPAQTR